jgi:hypothetical protein
VRSADPAERLTVALREDRRALVLRQATPDAVRLTDAQRVLAAQLHDRAARADGLRGLVAPAPVRSPLALRVEEHLVTGLAASPLVLPFPQVHHGAGKAGDLGHVVVLSLANDADVAPWGSTLL